MNKSDFFKKVFSVKNAVSITRTAEYSDFKVSGNRLYFTRLSTKKNWNIEVNQLFKVFKKLDYITPSILRTVLSGKIYSPAWAILVEAGLYDRQGNKTF